jgi:AcrR family transcriptional regulator
MPRLTEARRELRRAQITKAAVRCFVRHGMDRTSIADITAESGLSAGSIYAHYQNKAELVQAVAHELLERRVATLNEYAASPQPPSPTELITSLVAAVNPDEARVGIQTWGEATTDPAIRDIVVGMTDRMRDLLRACVEAWLIKVKSCESGDAQARAADLALHLTALYQAHLLRSALLDDPGTVDLTTIANAIEPTG